MRKSVKRKELSAAESGEWGVVSPKMGTVGTHSAVYRKSADLCKEKRVMKCSWCKE